MNSNTKSIRPFIGAQNFEISRNFYRELGFEEIQVLPNMCLFKNDHIAFYLQDAYVKDWVDNTMIFVEVKDVDQCFDELVKLNLPANYEGVRITPIRNWEWGRECFLHDPSGILWHFGEFKK